MFWRSRCLPQLSPARENKTKWYTVSRHQVRKPRLEDDRLHPTYDDSPCCYSHKVSTKLDKCFRGIVTEFRKWPACSTQKPGLAAEIQTTDCEIVHPLKESRM